MNMGILKIDTGKGVDEWNSSISKMMWSAAVQNIPKKKIPVRGAMVPWWTEECDYAVRDRNRAYKKSGSLPKEWEHAVIIPIVKPGKKHR